MQPWMTADEINEAIDTVLATSTGPDGAPATLDNIYLRQVREVDPATLFTSIHHLAFVMWQSLHGIYGWDVQL